MHICVNGVHLRSTFIGAVQIPNMLVVVFREDWRRMIYMRVILEDVRMLGHYIDVSSTSENVSKPGKDGCGHDNIPHSATPLDQNLSVVITVQVHFLFFEE